MDTILHPQNLGHIRYALTRADAVTLAVTLVSGFVESEEMYYCLHCSTYVYKLRARIKVRTEYPGEPSLVETLRSDTRDRRREEAAGIQRYPLSSYMSDPTYVIGILKGGQEYIPPRVQFSVWKRKVMSHGSKK